MKPALILIVAAMTGISARAADGGFLFTTFRDETTPMSEQIYFGISEDGRHWDALNASCPVLVSDVGDKGVRDSFPYTVARCRKCWLIATDLCVNRNRDWHRNTHCGQPVHRRLETTNLVQWTAPRLARVAPDDAGCVWAPEAIYDVDAGDYLVFWASTTGRDTFSKQRIWAAHTKDFRSFDAPFLYLEKTNHVIDIDIVRDGDTYYRFTKDDKTKSVTMATSKKLMGPWQEMPQFTSGRERISKARSVSDSKLPLTANRLCGACCLTTSAIASAPGRSATCLLSAMISAPGTIHTGCGL
jgi:hypothetical protein